MIRYYLVGSLTEPRIKKIQEANIEITAFKAITKTGYLVLASDMPKLLEAIDCKIIEETTIDDYHFMIYAKVGKRTLDRNVINHTSNVLSEDLYSVLSNFADDLQSNIHIVNQKLTSIDTTSSDIFFINSTYTNKNLFTNLSPNEYPFMHIGIPIYNSDNVIIGEIINNNLIFFICGFDIILQENILDQIKHIIYTKQEPIEQPLSDLTEKLNSNTRDIMFPTYTKDIDNLCDFHAKLQEVIKLKELLEDGYSNTKNRIEQIEAIFDNQDNTYASEIIQTIKKNNDVYKISIIKNYIVVHTNAILSYNSINQKYYDIGKLLIFIPFDVRQFQLLVLNQTYCGSLDKTQAPHVYPDGHMCYGTTGEYVKDSLKEGNYFATISLVLSIIKNPLMSDAGGKWITAFPMITSNQYSLYKEERKFLKEEHNEI